MAAGFSGDDFIFDTIDVNDFVNIPDEDDNNVLGFIDHHWPLDDLLLPPDLLSEDDALTGGGDFNAALLGESKQKLTFPEDPQLELISKIIDDSSDHCPFQGFPNNNNSSSTNEMVDEGKEDQLFHTSRPMSVLEHNGSIAGISSNSATSSSSSSCSAVGFTSNETHSAPPLSPPEPVPAIPGRARTKRLRPFPTISSRSLASTPFVPPPFSDSIEVESFGESNPALLMMTTTTKRQKKKNPAIAILEEEATAGQPPPVRKCMHCDVQKTPQWRVGPMGPKTLCNACGVRYKSGRLFPEYRPAASPTLIPSLHSNSHKKVVELRIKSSHKSASAFRAMGESPALKNCDLIQFIRRRE